MLTSRRGLASLVAATLVAAGLLAVGHVVRCHVSVTAFQKAYLSHPVPLGTSRLGYPDAPRVTLGADRLLLSADHGEVYRIDPQDRVTTLVTAPAGATFLDLQAEGRWVLTMATGSGIDAFRNLPNTELALLDTATGRRTVLVHLQVTDPTDVKQPRFDSPVLSHGSAYWVTRASGGTLRAVAHRYVIATRRASELGAMGGALGHGQSVDQVRPVLLATPTGLSWGVGRAPTRRLVPWPAPALPEPVRAAFHPSWALDQPATDGTAYAWDSWPDVDYWAPGMDEPRRFHGVRASVADVRGPLVALSSGGESPRTELLDTRTGGRVTLSGPFARKFSNLEEGHQRLSTEDASLTGIYRVPADLPELAC